MSRILIIEDETPMRTALADVLEGEGYRPIAAADGEALPRRERQSGVYEMVKCGLLRREALRRHAVVDQSKSSLSGTCDVRGARFPAKEASLPSGPSPFPSNKPGSRTA